MIVIKDTSYGICCLLAFILQGGRQTLPHDRACDLKTRILECFYIFLLSKLYLLFKPACHLFSCNYSFVTSFS